MPLNLAKRATAPSLSGTAAHVKATLGPTRLRNDAISHAPPALSFTVREIRDGFEHGEFEPFYQPQVHMRSLRVVGAAALARWRHPRVGIVRPHSFVAVLEEAGEVDALAQLMLSRATHFGSTLPVVDRGLAIAVNVSLRSLAAKSLVERIVEAVTRGCIDPHRIILDVTSPVPPGDSHSAIDHLASLHALGFAVSIDSYGHGYLSMQQLLAVAFSQLKIAPALMECARRHGAARDILASSIAAAHSAGIEVIAGRLESSEDWDLMAGLGCDIAQGNYIAKPMSGSDYVEWLKLQQIPQEASA